MSHRLFTICCGSVLAATFGVTQAASAALVANYTFDADGTSAASAIAGVTAGDATINATGSITGSVSTNPSDAYPFGDNVISVAASGGPQDMGTAVTNNAYWSITITIDNSVTVDLNSLSFGFARGGDSGRGFQIRSSATGATTLADFDRSFNSDTGSLAPSTTRGTLTTRSVTLSDAAFKNLTNTSVTFYFYHFAGSGGRNIDFDDLQVDASVSAVPEPATLGLCAIGLLAVVRRRAA